LKGGSTIGIPSPPAIWNPRTGEVGTPDIRDAERLQGFDPDWTRPAQDVIGVRHGHRWKLVGNAVSVPVAEWVGGRLATPGPFDLHRVGAALQRGVSWPRAAFGSKGEVFPVEVSMWPVRVPSPHLSEFLMLPLRALSARAAMGFYSRAISGGLRFDDKPRFLEDVRQHARRMARQAVA
jgi:DNA (cytosine-5)-methyltransferase 1